MRLINTLGAAITLMCSIVVSYNHTVALFEAGGYRGWMAHLGVVSVEGSFALGVFNLIFARLQGEPPGWPPVAGGIFGVCIVGWSNIAAGWQHGLPGVLLGLAIPISMVISEANLSHAIHRTLMKRRETPQFPPTECEESPAASPPECEEPLPERMETLTGREETLAGYEEVATTREETEETVETPREKAKRVAWEIARREGKPPTIRRLMREADVKEWPAREALKEVRAMWEKGARLNENNARPTDWASQGS